MQFFFFKTQTILFLVFFLFVYGCSSYKSVGSDKKEINTLSEKSMQKVFSELKKDERYKIKTDSANYKVIYIGIQDSLILGYKKKKNPEDTIYIDKKSIVSIHKEEFSRFKTDAFTIAIYGVGGLLIYLLVK